MTNDEIRIKIAESCGWRITSTTKYSWVVISPLNMEAAWSSQAGEMNDKPASFYLPNYPEDLNAMHKAEFYIPSGSGGFEQYADWLEKLTHDQENPITATAAQRAEAFLRTLNLWES